VLCLLLVVFPLLVNPYIVQIAITTITYSLLGLAFAFSVRAGLPRIDIAAWCSIGSFTTALLMNAGISFWLAARALADKRSIADNDTFELPDI